MIAQSMPTAIGRELLMELWSAPWENFTPKHLADLGIAFCSRTGEKRQRNEDRLAIAQVTTFTQEQFSVAIICDGVGGSAMGDIAATLAIATFLAELAQIKRQTPIELLLAYLIRKVDSAVRTQLQGQGMTTLGVVLVSEKGQIAAANIGDSRIFSWKPGIAFQQVSIDDTMDNDLRDLAIDRAILDARGLRGKLSQAIGEAGRSSADLRIVIFGNEKFTDNGVILATDGAWKADEKGFHLIARCAKTANDAISRIPRFASWTGGIDNISAIAIENIRNLVANKQSPQNKSQQASKITAWICDSKFVTATYLVPIRNTTTESTSPVLSSVAGEVKAATTKRRPPKPVKMNPPDTQLDLMTYPHANKHHAGVKPAIEISTDGTPASYREVYLVK